MTLSDSWDIPPSNPNNRHCSVVIQGEKKEHGIILRLVGACLVSLNLDWRGLIGIRVAAILKNGYRSISREPSTLRQTVFKHFLYIIKFSIFFVNDFFCNANIFKVIIFTKLSFQMSP